MIERLSKEEANYRIGGGERGDRCGRCSMFMPQRDGPNSCTAVMGSITTGMVCDLFQSMPLVAAYMPPSGVGR